MKVIFSQSASEQYSLLSKDSQEKISKTIQMLIEERLKVELPKTEDIFRAGEYRLIIQNNNDELIVSSIYRYSYLKGTAWVIFGCLSPILLAILWFILLVIANLPGLFGYH